MDDHIRWDLMFRKYDQNIIKQYCHKYNESVRALVLRLSPDRFSRLSCCICLTDQPCSPIFMTCCARYFCISCINDWLDYSGDCPHCRSPDNCAVYSFKYESLKSSSRRMADLEYLLVKIYLERKEQDGIPSFRQLSTCYDQCPIHLGDCKVEYFFQDRTGKYYYCTKEVKQHRNQFVSMPVSLHQAYLYHQRLLLNMVFDLDAYVEYSKRRQWQPEKLDEIDKLYQEIKDFINYQFPLTFVMQFPRLREKLVYVLRDWPSCTYKKYEWLFHKEFLNGEIEHPKYY